jgi:type I restriction enzyme S subunit
MKKGWQTKMLGEVLEKTETVNPLQSPNTEFDYIDVSSVSNTTFEIEETQRLKGKDAPSRARKLVRTNDIIFATIRPTLQRIAVVPEHLDKQVCSTGYFVLRPKQGIDHRFIFYSLFTEDFIGQMESLQKGASYPAVTDGDVRAQEIPVPPLAEQQRIVGLLDEAFEGIATAKANAEKNLQNARALFESHLQSVFTQRGPGWVEKPLAELCDSSRVITYGVIKLGDETPNGVPCLRTSNVRWLHIETDGMKRISPKLSAEYSRTILKGGEVLVNVRGTLGGVAVASPEMAGWNVSREVAVVPINSSRVNPAFLSYLIGSGTSQHWLGGVKKGAAYIGINIEDLRLLPVNVPKMERQLEVVEHLDSLQEETQRLARLYEQKLAALEALKKSLLHQAFTGAL